MPAICTQLIQAINTHLWLTACKTFTTASTTQSATPWLLNFWWRRGWNFYLWFWCSDGFLSIIIGLGLYEFERYLPNILRHCLLIKIMIIGIQWPQKRIHLYSNIINCIPIIYTSCMHACIHLLFVLILFCTIYNLSTMLKLPQLLSLVAGFTTMLIYGSSYTYGTLIPYVASYLYYAGDEGVTINSMALLLPISILVLNLGMPLINIKAIQFNHRITSAIAVLGVCLSIFAVSFGNRFAYYIVCYGIFFGVFIGYGYMAPIKNCYECIPTWKGLCSGVCIFGYGIAALLFNFILLKIINPDNVPIGQHNRFPETVSERVPFALKIMSGVYLGIGIIGVLLINPIKPKQQSSPQNQNAIQSQDKSDKQDKQTQQMHIEQKSNSVKQFLKYCWEKKLPHLTLILSLSVPSGMFVAFNYKQLGLTITHDDQFLTICGSLGAVFNGTGRFLWGIALDKFSYRQLSVILNGSLLICCAGFYFFENKYAFLIILLLTYSCYGGNFSIYPTQTIRMFGSLKGSQLYYLVFSGFSIGCAIQYVARLIFVTEGEQQQGFRHCMIFFACCSFLAALLSFLIKFEYDAQEQKLLDQKNKPKIAANQTEEKLIENNSSIQ